MATYNNCVPADFYSDDSDDEYHFNSEIKGAHWGEIHKFTKRHPGEIPDIGVRACIDGSHFNIKLKEEVQEKFNEIWNLWCKTLKKSNELLEKIQEALAGTSNPFETTLQFFGNANEPPKFESLSFAVLEAMELLKDTLKPSEIEEYLTDNIKYVAFKFLHDKSLTSIRLTVQVFELVQSNKIFVNFIRHLLDKREHGRAGQVAYELKLFNEFGLKDLLIPLFLEDKMVIFENFLNNTPHLQVKTVEFLDSLLTPEPSVSEKCEFLLQKYFITDAKTAKLEEKSINTLIDRLTSLYRLDAKEIAPLHYRYKLSKKLGFAVRNHYEDRRSSFEAFQDQLQQLSIKNDLDLQVELLERLLDHCKFKEASEYAKELKVPSERFPSDLVEFIENGTMPKKLKISSPENDPTLFVKAEDRWSDEEAVGDQLVPKSTGQQQQEEEENYYELKLDLAKILMVETAESFLAMIEELKSVKEIAFDVEHTGDGGVAILQIAIREKVFIVDVVGLSKLLDEETMAKMGQEVFNNAGIRKFAFGVASDIKFLQKTPQFSIAAPSDGSYTDLNTLGTNVMKINDFKFPHHEDDIKNLSLSKLVKLCFGKNLDKRNQLSNWCLRPLRSEQLIYAALDAFVLFEIHDTIVEILKTMKIAEDDVENHIFEK